VVVENVGGAGGTLGAAKVAKAAPDGYTCCCTTSAWPPRPALYRKLPYNV
jgi:tripartite-type tricarboxylate transporter receptor subunit TctC